jgi:hypothetical protein
MTVRAPGGGRIGQRERALFIVLGIVAVLAVAFLLLAGGDEGPIDEFPVPTPTRSETAGPVARPPVTDGAFEGKDPFQPLITPVGAGGGNGNGGTSSPSPQPTAVPTGGQGEEPHQVVLVDIFRVDGELRATVEVDGTEYNVAEGDTFAESFRVLDLTEECGTFVFGDERFTLCIGQEVQK